MSKKSGEAVEPVKVFKWDGVAVKNALDDAIRDVSCSDPSSWSFLCIITLCNKRGEHHYLTFHVILVIIF